MMVTKMVEIYRAHSENPSVLSTRTRALAGFSQWPDRVGTGTVPISWLCTRRLRALLTLVLGARMQPGNSARLSSSFPEDKQSLRLHLTEANARTLFQVALSSWATCHCETGLLPQARRLSPTQVNEKTLHFEEIIDL